MASLLCNIRCGIFVVKLRCGIICYGIFVVESSILTRSCGTCVVEY